MGLVKTRRLAAMQKQQRANVGMKFCRLKVASPAPSCHPLPLHLAMRGSKMYRIARQNCDTEVERRKVKRVTPDQIVSPGGLPRGQTAERAVAGYSKIRNEVLAKALNYMRFIEEWGSGLKRVNDVLGEYGIRKVSVEDAGFAVRMNVYREKADEVVKRENASKNPQDEGVNDGVSDGVNLSEGVRDVYRAVKRNPGVKTPVLLKVVGRSLASIERALSVLKQLRKIEFRGAPKTGGYYCNE